MNLPSLTKAREEIGQRSFVRWYLRFSLSLRNVEEMMAERGLMVDHTTVWRWCPKYGPMIYHRLRGKLKYTTTTCIWTKPTFGSPAGGCICSVKNQTIRQQSY